MTVSVIGLGDSAKEWFNTKTDHSIGVNDVLKFGHQVNDLLVINAPGLFQPNKENGYTNRLHTIITSKPDRFLTTDKQWKKWFPDAFMFNPVQFTGKHLNRETVYCSKTSPFMAMSLAVMRGAKNVIFFGVDFIGHRKWNEGTKPGDFEIYQFVKFFELCKGVEFWIGNENTALNKYLPVWNASSQNAPKEVKTGHQNQST